jgi:hypothetical protein
MDELSINVLVDAKQEYTKQLTNLLAPLIFEGIHYIYEEVKKISNSIENSNLGILQLFQQQLRTIPKWNQTTVDEEYNRIIEKTKCTWFEELLTAVFVSHTKILTAVRTTDRLKNVNLVIPTGSNFVHKCYIETAREFYKNPYLLEEEVTYSEKARNIRESLELIKNCINETVRKLLPVQKIIETYLTSNNEEEDEITTIKTIRQEKIKEEVKNFLKLNEEQQIGGNKLDENEIIEEKEIIEDKVEDNEIIEDKVEENNILEDNLEEDLNEKEKEKEKELEIFNFENREIEKGVLDLISNNTNQKSKVVSNFVQNQMENIKPKTKKIIRRNKQTRLIANNKKINFDEFSVFSGGKKEVVEKKYEYNRDMEDTYEELSGKKNKMIFNEEGTSDEESNKE